MMFVTPHARAHYFAGEIRAYSLPATVKESSGVGQDEQPFLPGPGQHGGVGLAAAAEHDAGQLFQLGDGDDVQVALHGDPQAALPRRWR